MPFTKELLRRVKDEQQRSSIITIYKENLENRSYKLREAAVLEIGEIATLLGEALFNEQFFTLFLKLLKDTMNEVKKAAIQQITSLVPTIPASVFTETLLPNLIALVSEKNQTISEVVASVSIDLFKSYPEEIPGLFNVLFEDITPQVRLIFLKRLNELTLTSEIIQKLVFEASLDDQNWRVREEIANHMNHLLASTQESSSQEQHKSLITIVGDMNVT